MPPTSMFQGRQRLSGLEFPSCSDCNQGTRAADATAAFFARMSPQDSPPQWEIDEGYRLIGTIAQLAPGAIRELFDPAKDQRSWAKGRDPFFTPKHHLTLDGPVTHSLMTAFAAKLGMAFYAEHVGQPLAAGGSVFTQFYFNAGLDRKTAKATLDILPFLGELRQGNHKSGKQFSYRYNTDDRSIIFAFVAFNDNLFVRSLATTEPHKYRSLLAGEYNGGEVRLGGLHRWVDRWTEQRLKTF